MRKLIYYIDKGNGSFVPFYEYRLEDVGQDEFYARQLCTYFIMRGEQYERVSNEQENGHDVIVLRENGRNLSGEQEKVYRGQGIHVEFRSPEIADNYRLLAVIPCETHFEVIDYLLKDIVDVPGVGQMLVTSSEIDEDRGAYVVYVEPLGGA